MKTLEIIPVKYSKVWRFGDVWSAGVAIAWKRNLRSSGPGYSNMIPFILRHVFRNE